MNYIKKLLLGLKIDVINSNYVTILSYWLGKNKEKYLKIKRDKKNEIRRSNGPN